MSLNWIKDELKRYRYREVKSHVDIPYHEKFIRYEKNINNLKVSMDILFNKIIDRQTNAIFDGEWIFKNSDKKILKGKTITESLKLRIINLNALIVMKIISCRISYIRDVFMLMPQAKDIRWIKEEVDKRHNFEDRMKKIKDKINSKKFKDDLQGVYGYIDEKLFNKYKNLILNLF